MTISFSNSPIDCLRRKISLAQRRENRAALGRRLDRLNLLFRIGWNVAEVHEHARFTAEDDDTDLLMRRRGRKLLLDIRLVVPQAHRPPGG